MARKRLKSDERKRQILSVALGVFASRGYGSATTASIAEAAEISEPILYRHFKNKRDLFYRVVESVSEKTLARWNGLLGARQSPRQKLLRLARDLPELTQEMMLENLLILRATADAHEDKELSRIVVGHYRKYVEFLEDIIREGVSVGEFRKGLNVRQCAWQLMGPGLAFSSTQGLDIDPAIKARVLKAAVSALIDSWT